MSTERRYALLKNSMHHPVSASAPSTGDLLVFDGSQWVAQAQSTLTIAESQITDGTILARLASTETVTGAWTFSNATYFSRAGSQILLIESDGADPNDRFLFDFNGGLLNFYWYDNSLASYKLPLRLDPINDLVRIHDGFALRIYDSTNTDYIAVAHDGTDINITHVGTTDWNITGLTAINFSGELTVGSGISTTGGLDDIGQVGPFAFMDWNSTHARFGGYDWDAVAWKDVYLVGSNVYLKPQGGQVRVPTGNSFRVYDSTDTDYGAQSHDGTNYSWAFTNTGSLNISGLTAEVQLEGGIDLRLRGGGILYLNTDDNAATGLSIDPPATSLGTTTIATTGSLTLTLPSSSYAFNIGNGDLTVAGNIYSPDATGGLTVAGGSSSGNGANIELYGGSHATLANDIYIDADEHTWRSQAGTTKLYLNTASSYLQMTGDIRIKKTGSHLLMYDTDDSVDTADYNMMERNGLALGLWFRDNSAATWYQILRAADAGAVTLYSAGTSEFSTQTHTNTGATSGAQVKGHGGTLRDVGFNVLPTFNFDVSDTLEAQHCGHMTGKTNTTSYTLTGPASTDLDFPVGGVCTVANLGTSTDYNIADTASCTIYYVSGSAVTDIAGAATIAPGGIATLWRYSASAIYMWGSGITP